MLNNKKEMMFINLFIQWIFIVIISFDLVKWNRIYVSSQEISPNVESLKYVTNNLSMANNDLTHIEKLNGNGIENKFYIKFNTIIRTGESRTLGAKYLNETRLPSNHDCLIWCLETASCNAAVYEEKNLQSCYLFDCGSPVRPLCKFTSHGYFTSSILKISKHSYELSQWGKQVQQEKSITEHHSDVGSTSPVPLNISTVSSSISPSKTIEQTEKKGSVCHHYQFQCVNTTECIAIYNVCDGIPQCPDGSDESSELKCPTTGMTGKEVTSNTNRGASNVPLLENKTPVLKEGQLPAPRPSASQNIKPYKKPIEHNIMQHKEDYKGDWPNTYSSSHSVKSGYHPPVDDTDGLSSPFLHKHSQFISANDPHVQSLNRWANDYDQYPPHSNSLEQQYNPYERMDEQYLSNQLPAEYDTGKGFAGYHPEDIPYWPNQDIGQDTSYTAEEFAQPGVQNMNKAMGYPDKESAYAQQMARTAEQYPEGKLSMHKPMLNQNQPSDMDDYTLRRYQHSRQQPYLSQEDYLQQRFPSYPQSKAHSMQNVDDALFNDDLIKASIINQLPKKMDLAHHEHDLKQFDVDRSHHSKEMPATETTDMPEDDSFIIVKPTASRAKTIQRTVLDFKMSVAELYESSSTHTHEANSAILALVVGVAVSFLLIVLLACRMKTLRRRMSRKGRALAHDADYLVNGMYL